MEVWKVPPTCLRTDLRWERAGGGTARGPWPGPSCPPNETSLRTRTEGLGSFGLGSTSSSWRGSTPTSQALRSGPTLDSLPSEQPLFYNKPVTATGSFSQFVSCQHIRERGDGCGNL